jgi:hypothetical protein
MKNARLTRRAFFIWDTRTSKAFAFSTHSEAFRNPTDCLWKSRMIERIYGSEE